MNWVAGQTERYTCSQCYKSLGQSLQLPLCCLFYTHRRRDTIQQVLSVYGYHYLDLCTAGATSWAEVVSLCLTKHKAGVGSVPKVLGMLLQTWHHIVFVMPFWVRAWRQLVPIWLQNGLQPSSAQRRVEKQMVEQFAQGHRGGQQEKQEWSRYPYVPQQWFISWVHCLVGFY